MPIKILIQKKNTFCVINVTIGLNSSQIKYMGLRFLLFMLKPLAPWQNWDEWQP